MTEEQSAALVTARSAGAMIKAMGMQAANQQRIAKNEYPVYEEADFERIWDEACIGENDVIGLYRSIQ